MTVHDNVAFGLTVRKRPKAEIAPRVEELLELVRLDGLAERYPSQLSGGQLQRMALARALAVAAEGAAAGRAVRRARRAGPRRAARVAAPAARGDPRDDDLRHPRPGGGDGGRRADRRDERGRIEQAGTPHELYESPRNEFVMSFIGPVNRLGDSFLRPHDIQILAEADGERHRGARPASRAPRLRGPRRADAARRPRHLGPGHPRERRAARAQEGQILAVRLPAAARLRAP